jgi:hypothetical protein
MKYIHHVSLDDYNIKGDQSLILFKISSNFPVPVRCFGDYPVAVQQDVLWTSIGIIPISHFFNASSVRVNMMYTHHIKLDRRMRRQC